MHGDSTNAYLPVYQTYFDHTKGNPLPKVYLKELY